MFSGRIDVRQVAVAALTLSLISPSVAAAQPQSTVEFSVTNFTDFHGHFVENDFKKEMGAGKMAALVEQVNQGQEYALTSSGDNIGGSAFVSSIAEDVPSMEILSAMGVDVAAVGNHELDKGIADLQGRVAEGTSFPHLAANIYRDGQRVLPASHIQELNGVKVGFVGSVTADTPNIVAKDGIAGLEFRDPVEETNAEAKRLKESGEADVVIALFHEDIENNKNAIGADVDVVFGGHSHQQAMGEVPRSTGNPLYYAQSGEFTKILTDYDFTFNTETKKIESVTSKQYDYAAAQGLTPNAEIQKLVTAAEENAKELGSRVVGTIDAPLRKPTQQGTEGSFSNFIATGQRSVMENATGQPVDLAIMNEGGVRSELETGDVTFEDANTAQPFANELQVGTLTGQDIIDIIELQWRTGEANPNILGFSEGFSYAYDADAAPGERFISATINGEPLDPAKSYKVAAAAFLFGGGDGFTPMTNATDIVAPGILDVDALIKHIGSGAQAPTAQTNVGVKLPDSFKAGEQATIELSSLNFSGEGDTMAKTVTAELGDASATADVNNEPADATTGNLGTVSVTIDVPADASGKQQLTITTDSGTKVTIPVTIEAGAGDDSTTPKPTPSEPGKDGSSDLSSNGPAGLDAFLIIAGILATLGIAAGNMKMLPKELQKHFNFYTSSKRR